MPKVGRKTTSELQKEIKELRAAIKELESKIIMVDRKRLEMAREINELKVRITLIEKIVGGGVWSEIKNILEEIAEALKEKKRRRWWIF